MKSTERARRRPAVTAWLGVLGVGLLLVVAYRLLKAYHVGKIGASTDIGGGLIVLLGYALVLVDAVGAVAVLVERRRARHRRDE